MKTKNELNIRLPVRAGATFVVYVLVALLVSACDYTSSVLNDSKQNVSKLQQEHAMSDAHHSNGFAKANNANLYYEYVSRTKEGPTVIFVHGSAGNGEIWEQQVPAFVNAGYQVLTFDLRNAGRSKSDPGKMASGSIADDIEAIRKQLEIDKLVIVGQAQGAEGALEYSLKYAEHTSGIVVAATYRGAEAEPAFVSLRNTLAPPANFAGRSGLQMRLSQHYLDNNPAGVQRFVEIDELNKARQSVDGKLDEKRLKAAVQSTGIPLDYAHLADINVPALVLSAERDDITPPALMLELAQNIPGATYMTVPDAGRYAFWENPEAFNAIVLDFLKMADLKTPF